MSDRLMLPDPDRVADTDTYDGAVSQLVHLGGGELLLLYHSTPERHVGPEGRIVARRSTNCGTSWSNPRPVIDEQETDPSSFSVVHESASGRVVVLAVAYAFPDSPDYETFPDREFVATHQVESTDGGHTWSDPKRIDQKLSLTTAKPFGGAVETTNGLMTAFQSDNHEIEVLFSTDDGRTWGHRAAVAHSPNGHQLSEPVPCRITSEKILIFGRDNETGGFYAIRSSDGGRIWNDPLFFAPGEPPNPIWVKRTGPNELTAVWGDRTTGCIYQTTTSAQLVWQDPTALADAPRKRLHERIGDIDRTSYWDGDAGDFGYPTFVQTGPCRADCLLVCYDEADRPNLWQMALY